MGVKAHAQSACANIVYGAVLTAAQWNECFILKQNTLGYTPLNKAGDFMTGPLKTFGSTASSTGFSIQPGTAPTSPNNGDIWETSAGIYAQVNGSTIGPIVGGTVTSVGLALPGIFSITGSPVTTAGTLTGSLVNQAPNLVFAGPASGSSAAPAFRSLIPADLPLGTSIVNPGTGSIEAVLPVQSITGSSHSFVTADLEKKTRRSNGGSAMSDGLPSAGAAGMVNGARLDIFNADVSAVDSLTAGAGTSIASGCASVAAGRDELLVFDLATTTWRGDANSCAVLLPTQIGVTVEAWSATLDAVAAGTYVGASSITTLGTISSGTWHGGVISGTYGGTGVNNGASTITLGAPITFAGAYSFTATLTGATSVTFPTSGTLAATAGTVATATNLAGGVANDIPYQTAPGATGFITPLANAVLVSNGSSVWSASTTLPSGLTAPSLTVTTAFTATGLVTNSDLTNSATTVNGQNCTLGATCTVTASATAITVGTTTIGSGVSNGLLYDNAGTLGNLATANNGVLVTSGAGVPSISTTLPSGLTAPSLTVTTAFTATGLVTLADISTQAANTIVGNATSGTASPTALAISSCSAAADALIWTTNSGFGCNTSITAAAVPASGLTGSTLAAGVTGSSLTSVGTLTGGATGAGFTLALSSSTISGTLGASNGGTGVNNGSSTITLGGPITFAGAYSFTATLTGVTSVTFPTSGTLATTAGTIATATNLAGGAAGSVPYQSGSGATSFLAEGTGVLSEAAGLPAWITTFGATYTWNGGIISGTYGGTGVNNGAKTLTLGASLTTTGTGAPTLAFPTTTSYTYTYPAASDTIDLIGTAQSITGTKTFGAAALSILGSSTGATTLESANASSSNYVITFPATTDTVVTLAATQTLTNKSISGSQINSGTVATANGGLGSANGSATGVPVFSSGAVTITATTGTGADVVLGTPKTNWTPSLAFGGASTGITYARQNGTYFVNGAVVYACIDIALSAVGSASGNAQILNLPVTSGNSNYGLGAVPLQNSGMTGISNQIVAFTQRNSTTVDIQTQGSTATANITNTSFTSSSALSGCITYPAS